MHVRLDLADLSSLPGAVAVGVEARASSAPHHIIYPEDLNKLLPLLLAQEEMPAFSARVASILASTWSQSLKRMNLMSEEGHLIGKERCHSLLDESGGERLVRGACLTPGWRGGAC